MKQGSAMIHYLWKLCVQVGACIAESKGSYPQITMGSLFRNKRSTAQVSGSSRCTIPPRPDFHGAEPTNLMNQEAQQSSSQDGTPHPDIVTRPCPFEPAEVGEIDGSVEQVLSGSGVDSLELGGDDG